MYGALWRLLPGPTWLRVCLLFILAAVAVYACFTWFFPTIAPHMPFNDTTVDAASGRGAVGLGPHTG